MVEIAVPDGPALSHALGCDCARCWVHFRDWWNVPGQVRVSGLALFRVFKAGCAEIRNQQRVREEGVSARIQRQIAEAAERTAS